MQTGCSAGSACNSAVKNPKSSKWTGKSTAAMIRARADEPEPKRIGFSFGRNDTVALMLRKRTISKKVGSRDRLLDTTFFGEFSNRVRQNKR